MKETLIGKLEDGMIVAENVMTKGGQCVLKKGSVLNRQSIMRLSFYSIKSIMVEEVETEADTTPEELPVESIVDTPVVDSATELPLEKTAEDVKKEANIVSRKLQSVHKTQAQQLDYVIVINTIKTSFIEYVHVGTPLDTNLLLTRTKELYSSCKTSAELFEMLCHTHSADDSVYAHCLNVALICRRLGKWLKFDSSTLDTLTLCGLLHDIGKLKVPEEILNKPGKYTDEEYDIVKKHTLYGQQLLQPLPIDDHIKKSARSHHERCDGSGYPSGLMLEDTDDFSMIVAIADVYDAMTAARSYRAPLCPFQVIANFEQDGLQKYNPKYILTFLRHIAGIYQNHRVLLSDGRRATIIMQGTKQYSKPIVQLDDNTCIDLSTETDLAIQTVF